MIYEMKIQFFGISTQIFEYAEIKFLTKKLIRKRHYTEKMFYYRIFDKMEMFNNKILCFLKKEPGQYHILLNDSLKIFKTNSLTECLGQQEFGV